MRRPAATTDTDTNARQAHADTDANLHARCDLRCGLPDSFAILRHRDQRSARYDYGIFQRAGYLRFSHQPKARIKFRDITNHCSTNWFPVAAEPPNFPGAISYIGNGQFVGLTAGCTFFTVSDGGFLQSIVVGRQRRSGSYMPDTAAGGPSWRQSTWTELSLSPGTGRRAAATSPGEGSVRPIGCALPGYCEPCLRPVVTAFGHAGSRRPDVSLLAARLAV